MFTDALEMELTLTVGEKAFKVAGGNIKTLELELNAYGFSGVFSFWESDEETTDKLFGYFIRPALMTVHLTIAPRFDDNKATGQPLILWGLATQKEILAERTIENVRLKGRPVLYRHYRIAVADPACVLWRQHFPCDLMTNRSVKDLFEAHRGSHVELDYDWSVLDHKHDIIALSLGTEENRASFYDFTIWYVSAHNGVWSYDPENKTYRLADKKPETGPVFLLDKLEVEALRVAFPPTARNEITVLNAAAENPQHKLITQAQAIQGLRRDRLVRMEIAADFEKCCTLEEQKLKIRQHELVVRFRRFPRRTYRPGGLYKLTDNGWSDKIFPHGKTYRVRSIQLKAEAVNPETTADHNMPHARYNLEMTSRLELKNEDWVHLPAFTPPTYPLWVEGTVVSDLGPVDTETYQVYQDSENSLDQYKVTIPLWNNQQVVLPFEPNFLSGHFYFPVFKGARVLVSLNFHSGRIERFLEWRAGARLPLETQGNQMLFGQTALSKTAIQHIYVNGKPVWQVQRTSDKDTETLKMVEGNLILETKEEE